MKKCMLCGRPEIDDAKATCPACGEATWERLDSWVVLDALVEPKPSEPAPVKRGPGRPRKSQ